MSSLLGVLIPGRMAKLNFVADLTVLVLLATLITRVSTGHPTALQSISALMVAVILILVWTVTSAALHHYDAWAHDRSKMDDFSMVFVLVAAESTILAILGFVLPSELVTPHVWMFVLLSLPSYLGIRMLFRKAPWSDPEFHDVLVVGNGPLGLVTRNDLSKKTVRRVVGVLRFPDEKASTGVEAKLLGTSDDLEHVLEMIAVTEVFIAGNALKQGPAIQRVIETCERFGVPFAMPAISFRMARARMASNDVADGYHHFICADYKPKQLAVKRLFDIVASCAALWLLLPLFAVVMAAIKLTSKGPIFFRQVRAGLHGRTFKMLKFRSMVVNAEELKASLAKENEMTGPVFKMKNDPRITAIGRFIRKYSIDELPQLINVLRGDMSVVGPRPPVLSEVAKYQPWQRRRLSVRPGLTCIWQVSGRNQISFEEWMYLDMQYIDEWSLSKDLGLIFRTFPVVLTGRGAS